MTDPADLYAATQSAAEDEHNAGLHDDVEDADQAPPAAVLPTDGCRGCDNPAAPVGASCPSCGSLDRAADHVITWNSRDADSLARSLLDTDWDALNAALPGLSKRMVWVLRENAAAMRAGRVPLFQFDDNDPLAVADIAELSQRLYAVFDVVGRFGKEMTTVAKEALAEIAVDAEETKLARVVIPTGAGGPSIVAARERTIETTFDDARILAVIAEMAMLAATSTAASTFGCPVEDIDAQEAYEAGLRAGARYGAQFAIDMRTNAKWKITALRALGADALANGKYRIAAVIESAFTQKTVDGEYKVTVENR